MIQKLTGSDIFRIDTVKGYSTDYHETTKVAKQELRENARPELSGYVNNIADYRVIYLGYPNWCGPIPMAVCTFIEAYDFTGKIIIPFCTHEGSGMGRSESDLRKFCSDARVMKGLPIRGGSVQMAEKSIADWLRKLGVIE